VLRPRANQRAKGKNAAASIFEFPFSIFECPFSNYQSPITISQALVPPRNEASAHNLLWNQRREIQAVDIFAVFWQDSELTPQNHRKYLKTMEFNHSSLGPRPKANQKAKGNGQKCSSPDFRISIFDFPVSNILQK
jgi:hypothetical protein